MTQFIDATIHVDFPFDISPELADLQTLLRSGAAELNEEHERWTWDKDEGNPESSAAWYCSLLARRWLLLTLTLEDFLPAARVEFINALHDAAAIRDAAEQQIYELTKCDAIERLQNKVAELLCT